MVKSKLCLDNEKMGDPDRAHRYFAKNPSFALIRKKFAWIKILHRLPPPGYLESGFSYYCQGYSRKFIPKSHSVFRDFL